MNNGYLQSFLQKNSTVYILNWYRMFTDSISFAQQDRSRTLKQQLRCVMNIITNDFNTLISSEDDINIFTPLQQLNGQCLSDFYLTNIDHLKKKLNDQKLPNFKMRKSLIREFCEDDGHINNRELLQDLKDDEVGYIQRKNELINGLYGANSLQRCFFGQQKSYETAKMLLGHIFEGKISYETRNLLLVAMPMILACPVEPFPLDLFGEFFKHRSDNGLCFYQNLSNKQLD